MIETRRRVSQTKVQSCDVTKMNFNLAVVHCNAKINGAFLRLCDTEQRKTRYLHLEVTKHVRN